MEKKKRNFNDFLTEEETDGIKKVAIEYATENDTITYSYLANKYNLSATAIKKVIEYAITNCIVSYQVATVINEKSRRNQLRHCKSEKCNVTSDNYYSNLLQKRLIFVKSFDDKKVLKAVECYLDNPHLMGASVARSLGLSLTELNALLKKAIVFNIIDDDKVEELKKISFNKNRLHTPDYDLFKCYELSRKHYKYLNTRIAKIQFQLESYDNYSFDEVDLEHSKEFLEKNLAEAQAALDRIIKFL